MPAFVDRSEVLRSIVENVTVSAPITLEHLSPEQRAEVERVATRERLTPEAVLVLSRAETLKSIRDARAADAVARAARSLAAA